MKKLVAALLLIITISTISFYVYQYQNRKSFHCNTQSIIQINVKGDSPINVNTYVDIMFTSKNYGVILFSGSVTHGDNNYILRRNVFFSFAPFDVEKVNKTVFTHEVVNPQDNTPEEIWQKRVLPQVPGIEYYSEVVPLKKNALLIKAFSKPLVICVLR